MLKVSFDRNKFEKVVFIGLAAFLVLGLSSVAMADSDQDISSENFREILKTADGVIRSIRFGNESAAENGLDSLESDYNALFSNVDDPLDDEIRNLFSDLQGSSELKLEKVKELRGNISELGESEGPGLSIVYKHSVFFILAVSFGLGFTANMISRLVVDWEEVNEVKRRQSELQDELKKARNESDTKKMHKLQQKQQDFMQEHMGTLFSPMKTMIFIFIPFIIVFSLLRSTYGGWVVAWVPFTFPWPDIGFPMIGRFFKGTFVSLGFFGWYLICYFGFSQILRKILVPSE